jgi:hypothetical protein
VTLAPRLRSLLGASLHHRHLEYARRVRERPVLIAVCALACLGVLWAIWSVPLVMTNDGPQAVLTAHMESHFDDPDSIFARQFTVGFGLSGRGFSLVYRPIAELASFPNSLRVAQALVVLALAFAVVWLSAAISGGVGWSSPLGFSLAFSWTFYMGFYAFALATALGLAVLAFVVSRTERLSLLARAAISTALLVQLFMHGFAVFVTLILVTLVVGARSLAQRRAHHPDWRRDATADLLWLGASCLPSVAVVLIMRSGQREMAAITASGATTWAPFSDLAHSLPRLAIPGSTLLGLALWAIAIGSIVRAAVRLRRRPRRPEEAALFVGAVGLVLAGLVLPLDLPGWQFFSPRFLLPGLALSLCLLGCESATRSNARALAGVAVGAFVLACVWNAFSLHQRLARACADAISGLEHTIPRRGFQLPVVFDANCGLTEDAARRDVPYSTPLSHFPTFFAVTHGGAVPYSFAGPAAVHAFVPRDTPLVPVPPVDQYWSLSREDERLQSPHSRAALLTELLVFGSFYENILVFGALERDRALLLERGYVIDFEHGSFVNARHVPCPVELVVPVHPGDPPIMVHGGLADHKLWAADMRSAPGESAIVASLRMLCGDVWVNPQWRDGVGRCKNADDRGRLAVRAARAGMRVTCARDAQ